MRRRLDHRQLGRVFVVTPEGPDTVLLIINVLEVVPVECRGAGTRSIHVQGGMERTTATGRSHAGGTDCAVAGEGPSPI